MSDQSVVLVVGLGNPGVEYQNTRHNVGLMVCSALPQIPRVSVIGSDVFMNTSGSFVAESVKKYSVPLNRLVVIHDDWAFAVGEFRFQFGRGPNRHRGVASVIDQLGSQEFWRVRVGIGDPPVNQEPSDYVLDNFNRSELRQISDVTQQICYKIKEFASNQG